MVLGPKLLKEVASTDRHGLRLTRGHLGLGYMVGEDLYLLSLQYAFELF
jgi:hypothetical protein